MGFGVMRTGTWCRGVSTDDLEVTVKERPIGWAEQLREEPS